MDIVVELASYGGYSALDEKLRSIGFKNDVFSGVICRYNYQGIIVDVMPTDPAAIGFSNKWYAEGFETAILKKLDAGTSVKLFDTPYFMASKMEAFSDRGQDLFLSQDLEDMIFVIEHADDFIGQMKSAPTHVWQDLRDQFATLIKHENFEEAVYAHSESGYSSNTIEPIMEKLRKSFDLGRSIGN